MLQHRFITRGMAALAVLLAALAAFAPLPLAAQAIPFASPAFQTVWQRNDLPVLQPQTAPLVDLGADLGLRRPEPYAEAPGGQRLVQYFDKARMEINNPSNPSAVTNGLLVREMVGGRIALGDVAPAVQSPAAAGGRRRPGRGQPVAPTYASFSSVASLNADRPRARTATGQTVNQSIDQTGVVAQSAGGQDLATYRRTTSRRSATTSPNVSSTSSTSPGRSSSTASSSEPARLRAVATVMGLPITEPYWTQAIVGGQENAVLVQLFERRALTYTPTNPAGFQVEMGNVGQHYFRWRYPAAAAAAAAVAAVPVFTAGRSERT